jgi:hypothetical protein
VEESKWYTIKLLKGSIELQAEEVDVNIENLKAKDFVDDSIKLKGIFHGTIEEMTAIAGCLHPKSLVLNRKECTGDCLYASSNLEEVEEISIPTGVILLTVIENIGDDVKLYGLVFDESQFEKALVDEITRKNMVVISGGEEYKVLEDPKEVYERVVEARSGLKINKGLVSTER